MTDFLNGLARRVEKFTGCKNVSCELTRGELRVSSDDGICHVVIGLSAYKAFLTEVYGRFSQIGLTHEERDSIKSLLLNSLAE